MARPLAKTQEETRTLSAPDKEALLRLLWEELDGSSDPDVDAAWLEGMLRRAVVNKGGRPRSPNPRQLISLRLPPEVVQRWRATGPGWQTRMADRLAKTPIPRVKE